MAGATDPDLRVLFVCTANVCRSPYAELRAAHLLGPGAGVVVSSAGTRARGGQPIDPSMADQLRTRGVEVKESGSRPLTMALVDSSDLVLTAEVAHRKWILRERPELFRSVLTLGQLARAIDNTPELGDREPGRDALDELRRQVRPADPLDDVPDPIGGGEPAAAEAAALIDELLQRIVPLLSRR